MNTLSYRTESVSKEQAEHKWYVVDAENQVVGRLCTHVAAVLRGKTKPSFTPHADTGDFVIVLNADKIKITGTKRDDIVYQRYSFYPSGLKITPMRTMLERHPERVLREAVRRMMPKNALSKHMLLKLKLYNSGQEHRHQAQMPEPLPV